MHFSKKLKTFKASFFSGRAFKRIEKNDYRGAAIVLMKICREMPDTENIEFLYYSLGQCHFKLGQAHSSLYWLSKSINLYEEGLKTKHTVTYQLCHRDAIELYCKVLRITGYNKKADEIIHNIDFGS